MSTNRILVLGHGQLGLMLAAEAAKLGLTLDRLDLASGEYLPGSSPNRLAIARQDLLEGYDVISAELEHLPDTELIQQIKSSKAWINRAAFELLVDRSLEKNLFDQLQLATAAWCKINSRDDLVQAVNTLGAPLVVKTTRGGYDGRGQWRIHADNIDDVPPDAYGSLIAESMIDFSREVSVIGARNRGGTTTFLPLAENIHREGILRYSLVRHAENAALLEQGKQMLGALLEHLDYQGVMAMECFETGDGLVINEVAPRVHNSGHWSQLGTVHNQFALHNRALAGLPLPAYIDYEPVIMLNLIGCDFNPAWLGVNGIQVHWYGKERRDGRKMGHINIDASDAFRLHSHKDELAPLLDEIHRRLLIEAVDAF